MSGSTAIPTILERWKELAEVENSRARKIWGSTGGWYQRPEKFEAPEITEARKRRDDQIEIWAAAGMSTREISARVEMAETSVARILRIRRLEAGDDGRGEQWTN